MTKLTNLAKGLRKRSTDVERLLWKELRCVQFEGIKFRRQHPIGKYIVDFVSLEKSLIIELDGGQHAKPNESQRDRERDKWLEKEGYTVLRFWDNELIENRIAVLKKIREAVYYAPSP
ncbi:MAG: endonuclease domain-containing protein [Nitrospinota bacterium]|nr:endonuclease domain-containing protein [Nitrospinota bacterium]